MLTHRDKQKNIQLKHKEETEMYNSNWNGYGNPPQYAIGMNWVSSINEAEQMELPPGGTAVFFDKVNDGLMYIRTRDSYNIYNTRTFNINEVKPIQPESPYVTRNELEEMFSRYLGGKTNDTVRTDEQATDTSKPERKANA